MSALAVTTALLIFYAGVGAVCGVVAWQAAGAAGRWRDVAFALVLWPFWLPLWLGARRPAGGVLSGSSPAGAGPGAHPATGSLLAALARVQGSPLAPLLPDPGAVRSLAAKLADVSTRIEELDDVLARPAFDLEAARARRDEIARDGASPEAQASAALRAQNIERLRELRARFAREVDDVNELLSQLVIQVEVVRFVGTAQDDTRDLLRELLLRVEGLGQMLDDRSAPRLTGA
jgi:hypothetical protein